MHSRIREQGPPAKRTIVFIDYQNMYRSAQDAFRLGSGGLEGNIRPYSLGRQMVRSPDRVLTQVRVYTGIHTPVQKPKLNAMMQRRIAGWLLESPDCVKVLARPLSYGRGRPPREKGVDVELAIDFVRLALEDRYDVAVLASGDTDLRPALQFVADKYPDKELVTLGYQAEDGRAPAPLDLPRGILTRHWITKADFDRFHDQTDYFMTVNDRSAALDAEQWHRTRRRFDE